ncbi:retrovirus-related pol polyprotein from transposon TNT 1-94 [Tanacetum coccineum]
MVKPVWNNAQRANHQNFAKTTHPYAKKNLVPRAVLMKYGLVSINTARQNISKIAVLVNTARQVNAAYLKTTVNAVRPITPQQNGVTERRNRILIEAARTMLADSKLATTFWVEAVNIACYVQNKVFPPFYHLGKFDGKANEGFFVRYSLNSIAFRAFNSRTRIMEENLHIRFSESTPNVVGSRPDWLFDIDALTRTMNYEPIVTCTQSNGFASTKASDNVEKEDNVRRTNNVNVAGTNEVNVVGGKTSIELPFDPNMPTLENYSIFDFSRDDEDDSAVADMNNLDTTLKVIPNPTTRIHKDHPLDQIEEEVYVCQQPGLEGYSLRLHAIEYLIWRAKKHCHDQHQAPRAWYETLSTYLLDNGFQRGKIDKTLFIKRYKEVKDCKPPIGNSKAPSVSRMNMCKKQTVDANSTTEVEYVAASSCYRQVLWIQNQLLDYGRALQLADEKGVDCLPNSTIFEQLALMSPKTTAWNEFSSTMASAIIGLATN